MRAHPVTAYEVLTLMFMSAENCLFWTYLAKELMQS